jgi:hypothetical protein
VIFEFLVVSHGLQPQRGSARFFWSMPPYPSANEYDGTISSILALQPQFNCSPKQRSSTIPM